MALGGAIAPWDIEESRCVNCILAKGITKHGLSSVALLFNHFSLILQRIAHGVNSFAMRFFKASFCFGSERHRILRVLVRPISVIDRRTLDVVA